MEFISGPQMQKYQTIMNKIDNEFKRSERLEQEIEKETNKLIAIRIATERNITNENIFRVIVKVFSSVFDLFYLYKEDITRSEYDNLVNMSNCKFYVVQVYISKLFEHKLINQNWMINVNVRNNKMSISKSTDMKRKQISNNYILIVLPFDMSTEPSMVTTSLFMYFESFCYSFKISTINIDISYHFSSYENLSSIIESPLIRILQNYNRNLDHSLLKIPSLEYNFKCKCTARHFFESLIKNCYHRLKPEMLSAFSPESDMSTNMMSFSFNIANKNDTVIKLDNSENVLSIASNLHELYRIKKYLIGELACQSISIDKMWLVGLVNLKQYLRGELGQMKVNTDNLKIIYEELNKLISNLPV